MDASLSSDRRGFSNRALFEQLERADLDGRDRGLATHLVYGVLRHQIRIDHLLNAAARDPKGLKGEVRQIARVAALEILELGRPLPIAANEAAELTKRLDPSGKLARFVSALLRSMSERQAQEEAELATLSTMDKLVRRWSLPRWIARRWIAQLGEEQALTRAQALGTPPWVDLRVDLHRSTRDELIASLRADYPTAHFEASELCQSCIRSRGAGDVFFGPLHDQGLISVQALGSQLAVQMLAPQSGERVLDACAGLGTKTVQLAEMMGRRGQILAVDLDGDKLDKLAGQLTRCELDAQGLSIRAIAGDLRELDLGGSGPFDRILLDAPCTGMGNLGRHPELRGYLKLEDISAATQLQRELLLKTAPLLAAQGKLAYAVCSLEPEEGPELVRSALVDAGLELLGEHVTTPERDLADGFYVAVLRQSGERK